MEALHRGGASRRCNIVSYCAPLSNRNCAALSGQSGEEKLISHAVIDPFLFII